ncbi:MAG TPA: hypothetical protein VH107_20450 [Lacipirellulaceae bacterium]|jgi:hypothetical protein|nr:hypothetical protein [Lacipirellulaceae bacterium]
MPPLNNKRPILDCKRFGPSQFANFQPTGFPQLDGGFHVEHGLAAATPNVNMNRQMLIAVEKEFVTILFKYFWHVLPLRSSPESLADTISE